MMALFGTSAPAASQSQNAARVLTLRDAVSTSLESSPQLENAQWQLAAAQDQAREAWGSVMPTVNLNAS